jgi:hypothetical protein
VAVRGARPNFYAFLLAGAGLACSLDPREVSTGANPSASSNGNAAGGTDGRGGSSASPPAARGNPPSIPFDPSDTDDPSERDELDTSVSLDSEFSALVAQEAPWGDLRVKVARARLYRGPRPAELASRISFSEQNLYAVLDINITQLGNELTDLTARNTWDLILADGTRLPPLNPLGVSIVTGDSPTVHSYYPAEEGTAFEGAALEVNGADRATFEPLRIPLDTEQVFEHEIELSSLVGQLVAPVAEGEVSFEVLDASYGINLLQLGRRAPRGLRLVMLNCRVRFLGSFSLSFSSTRDGPRVSVDGNALASIVGDIDTIPSGGFIDFVTVYEIDPAATGFDVVFDTGDTAFTRLPVVLPPAQ